MINELKLNREQQETLNEIIERYNFTDFEDVNNLFILFDEFYKKFGTFSIFSKSSNKKYIEAIKKVKEENEKKKKSQHYLLNIDQNLILTDFINNSLNKTSTLYDNGNNKMNLYSNIKNISVKKNLDKEMHDLANKLEFTRSKEMEFYNKRSKRWEQKKERDNIKFNLNEKEDKKKDKKLEELYIGNTLRELSIPNEQFKKLLYLMKKKKQNEYEKDPYIMDYKNDIRYLYTSNKGWELQNKINIGTTQFTRASLNDVEEIKRGLQNIERPKKLIVEPTEYGTDNINNYEYSRVWKDFEFDLDRFIKDQYTG